MLDPDGKRVVCSESHWLAHVSANHPEMKGAQAQRFVATVIQTPEFIYQDATYPNRRIYYRRGIFPAPLDRAILKIVVEYPIILVGSLPPARVVTAYPVEAPKKGEQLLWPSPDQPQLL